MERASKFIQKGHSQFRRKFTPRHHRNADGQFSDEFLRQADHSFIGLKLGGQRMAKTNNSETGTFSARYTQQLVRDGVIPVHKVIATPNIGPLGIAGIRKNMKAITGPAYRDMLPKEKCLVVLVMDGINIEGKINVDTTTRPMVFTGMCRHCDKNVFNTMDDANKLQEGLRDNKFHVASESEVICLGLIHPTITTLIPIAEVPTCKGDEYVGQSTHAISFLLTAVEDAYYEYKLDSLLGPLATLSSDGAAAFRKGAGIITSDILPPEIRLVYDDCSFFNTVGGQKGTTPNCDLDHLGKRNRVRGKSDTGSQVGNFCFNKWKLAKWFGMSGVVKTESQALKLLNPDDNMDVKEMVRYLQAVKKIASKPYEELPLSFKSRPGSADEYRAIKLYGEVEGCLAALIIGHHGSLDEDGTHMSVTEILQTAAKFSFLLFFIFRKHKTAFFPNQHYRNCQDTVKNMFVCVTLAKVNGIKDYIFFQNSTKRLEQLFGVVRSMVGGDLNFDSLGLRRRLGDASALSQIYARHPEWDSPPRKLTCSFDRKKMSFLAGRYKGERC